MFSKQFHQVRASLVSVMCTCYRVLRLRIDICDSRCLALMGWRLDQLCGEPWVTESLGCECCRRALPAACCLKASGLPKGFKRCPARLCGSKQYAPFPTEWRLSS